MVGQALAAKLAKMGHRVMVGTRSPSETLARSAPNAAGQPPLSAWLQENPAVHLGTYAEAAQLGAMVINATNGMGSLAALHQAGAANLSGKILIDIANPLDFSRGMPPSLSVSNTDSLAEQIQAAFPETRVVKTLNTVTAAIMVAPQLLANGEHTIFVSGNDPAARAQVSDWLKDWFGWKHILDLGDITSARGVEMYLPLWLRLWGACGTPMLNVRIVT
jgi:predicted dinucleotide-binding enzyme